MHALFITFSETLKGIDAKLEVLWMLKGLNLLTSMKKKWGWLIGQHLKRVKYPISPLWTWVVTNLKEKESVNILYKHLKLNCAKKEGKINIPWYSGLKCEWWFADMTHLIFSLHSENYEVLSILSSMKIEIGKVVILSFCICMNK